MNERDLHVEFYFKIKFFFSLIFSHAIPVFSSRDSILLANATQLLRHYNAIFFFISKFSFRYTQVAA